MCAMRTMCRNHTKIDDEQRLGYQRTLRMESIKRIIRSSICSTDGGWRICKRNGSAVGRSDACWKVITARITGDVEFVLCSNDNGGSENDQIVIHVFTPTSARIYHARRYEEDQYYFLSDGPAVEDLVKSFFGATQKELASTYFRPEVFSRQTRSGEY